MAFLINPDTMARRLAVEGLVAACLPAIRQLVERFDLAGRTMMSVGPGAANEEIAFLKCGVRRAFLFDIDEHHTLQAILPQLHEPATADAPIVYVLEDFTKVQPDRADLEPIDLLYFSGFTPDEQRRGEKRLAHQVKRKAKRNALARLLVDDPAWPADTSPLHEIVLLAIERYLIVGGILIIQSYCDGINPRTNAGYVAAWEAILRQCGVTLLEGYCFAAAPAVTLWIGIKIKDAGPAHGAHHLAELRRTLAGRLPLQCFHGRAQVDDKRIIRFYPSNRVLRRALAIKRRLVG